MRASSASDASRSRRWKALQDPVAVGATTQGPALGERSERGRDRRPAGADEETERLVGQLDRDDDHVLFPAPPALGEVPEEREQPMLEPAHVLRRGVDRE